VIIDIVLLEVSDVNTESSVRAVEGVVLVGENIEGVAGA